MQNPDRKVKGQWKKELGMLLAAACGVCLLLGLASLLVRDDRADAAEKNVQIFRVMTSNPGTCLPVDGYYSDWVELVNLSDENVNLNGWRLSNGLDVRAGCVFADVTLAPSESVVVYAGLPAAAAQRVTSAPFTLDADGDSLTLYDSENNIRDFLEIPAMSAGSVYALDEKKETYRVCSPYEVLDAGMDLNAELAEMPGGTLVISEVMASNQSVLQSSDGQYYDWIEIYNGGAEAVNLKGYSLSENELNRRRYVFPDYTLDAGEYLLVYASGLDRRGGELHATFRLSADGESVRLFDPKGQTLSVMEYESLEADQSAARLESGQVEKVFMASPGFPNTQEGMKNALSDEYVVPVANKYSLYINEVQCSMTDGPDWVELINQSGSMLDLSGFGLSNNPNRPRKWQFPQGTGIQPGGYLLVALAPEGKESEVPAGALNAGFGLDVEGAETLVLSAPDGSVVDRLLLMDQRRDVSYGRAANALEYRYFATPTPGAVNSGTSFKTCARPVEFSVSGGVKYAPVTLELRAEPGMSIFYTTDGTEPNVHSDMYNGPISISENTVVKAMAWGAESIASYSSANTYLFEQSHSCAIVCVSGNPEELTGPDGTLNTGKVGEGYHVYAEIYAPDGTQLISQNCGLKLNGRSSRNMYDQRAFRLMARGRYGDTTFSAPLFSRRDYEEYHDVVVRAAGQDNQRAYMRDVVFTYLARNTSLMYQESETVAVYVNGQYWGVYHLRERITPTSICQFENWTDPDRVDLLEENSLMVIQGSNQRFKEMMEGVKKYGVATDDLLAQLRQYMDVENYLDYVIMQMYNNNQDLNNVRVYRSTEGDGLWRWVLFDTDLGFLAGRDSVNEWLSGSGKVGSITSQSNRLFTALMENPGMRDYFLTRFGELLATDLSTRSVMDKIMYEYGLLKPEMERQCQRWDWSVSKWESEGAKLIAYAETRARDLINSLIDNFNLSSEQAQHYFGTAMQQEGM